MKRTLHLLFTLLIIAIGSQYGQSQLVINEIMYNPPESGTDSLEFVELFNNTDNAIDLQNYELDGFGVVFENISIPAGGYVVAASNAVAFTNAFGLTAVQATGGLKNGGEILTLLDANGDPVSSVEYGDNDPWPIEADGSGYSLELCAGGNETDVNSWHLSSNNTGVFINGSEIFATPGTENTSCAPQIANLVEASNFTFTPSDITISVGETVTFKNVEGNHNVNGSQLTFPDNPETFYSGTPSSGLWTYEYTFNIPGVYHFQCDPHASSMQGTVTVEEENVGNYPNRTIGEVTTIDANGVADSLDVFCTLVGTAHGINFRPGGLQFTLIDDNNDGIGVFVENDNFGYDYQEGDIVKLEGVIGQYNGLIQMYAVSAEKVDNGTIFEPTVVTTLGEHTESQLVRFEDVSLVDPSQWQTNGNFNVELTNGTYTFNMRIDGDTDISGEDAPTGTFTVTGIGSQFDNESPYLDGYQLLPRYKSDIDPYTTDGGGDFPDKSIGEVTTVDGDGVGESLGLACTLRGVVHGVNFRSSGLQFTIIDQNQDGIGVFSPSDDFGYSVNEGDLIEVEGTIDQFNGLLQIKASNISFIEESSTFDPIVVNDLGEDTESQLVKFASVLTMVNPDQWLGDGTSFNVDLTDGTNTFVMRIDSDTELATYTPPTINEVRVTGIGGQYDNSAPYTEGYQIFPRYLSDVEFVVGVNYTELPSLSIFPNPTSDVLNIQVEGFERAELFNVSGQIINSVNEPMMNMVDYNAGVYFLKVITTEGTGMRRVVIK